MIETAAPGRWSVDWIAPVEVIQLIIALIIATDIIYTVSHRSEYTPHIFVNIWLYLFMWQHLNKLITLCYNVK